MKNIFAFLLAAGLAVSAIGRIFTNESPAGMKIIWAVPMDVWPPSYEIWTYKTIPQHFSDAVISNAMAIGSFTMKDRVKLPPEALAIDKNAMRFDNKDETKELVIAPKFGYIDYRNEDADAGVETVIVNDKKVTVPAHAVGVPDLPEATRLGLKYARLLGIEASQFATKPGSHDFDLHWIVTRRGWTDQKTKKKIEETNDFGVSFTRCIDGFSVSTFGDLEVYFGNNAKVSRITVSWRNLEPYKLNDNFVTPEQIVKSIADGQTALPRLSKWPLEQIKTLTITNATPRYSRGRKRKDEPLDFVVPALQLDAIIDNGKTNRYIWFQTGIFPPEK